jgi:endonuclease/exonuclease/phosphatase family metal-dependent hydrolase
MTFALLLFVLFVQLLPLLFAQDTQPKKKIDSNVTKDSAATDSMLLESGQPAKPNPVTSTTELKIVTYNIRWRSGDDLKELIKLFREDVELGKASIIALQEVDRKKKRSGNTNTVKLLADELGLYYAWAAPPGAKAGQEEETGVALLSVYPLSDVRRIVLPHDGPGHRRRVALGACIKVDGVEMRVYSAHAETRISMEKKLDQLNALLEDLNQHAPKAPAIIMGDFNTWQPDAAPKTTKLFSEAGFTTPFDSQKTFSQKVLFVPVDFRLDWIWLRGLEAKSHGIDREVDVSDHWPLWTNVKLVSAVKNQ